jgi:hypothetical protein
MSLAKSAMCGETHENQKTLNCCLALCTAAGSLLWRMWRHSPVYLGPVYRSLIIIQQAAAAAAMCVVCCRRLLAEEDVAAGPGPISAAACVLITIQLVQCIALNNARLLFCFLQLLCHAVGFLQSRAVRSSLPVQDHHITSCCCCYVYSVLLSQAARGGGCCSRPWAR